MQHWFKLEKRDYVKAEDKLFFKRYSRKSVAIVVAHVHGRVKSCEKASFAEQIQRCQIILLFKI